MSKGASPLSENFFLKAMVSSWYTMLFNATGFSFVSQHVHFQLDALSPLRVEEGTDYSDDEEEDATCYDDRSVIETCIQMRYRTRVGRERERQML